MMHRANRLSASALLHVVVLICPLVPAFAQDNLAAWRATRPGQPGTILLLGSIHLLRESDYPLPPIVDTIYHEADNIVFEIDLDDVDPATIQTQFTAAAMLDSGTSLRDVLEPQLYDRTAALATDLGIDVQLFSRFEPWFVATMLMSFGLSQQGYEPRFGIEQYILSRAIRDGKEVLGVEALEAQVAVFDLLSGHDQTAFLEQTLAELQRDDVAMRELVEAWRAGELAELQADLMSDFAEFPGLYDRLVVDRNAAWIAVLEDLSQRNEVSAVIVGALHLVGKESVIELLRARGYEISEL